MSPSEPYQQTPATTAGQRADRKAAARAFLNDIDEIMCEGAERIAAEQTPRVPTFYKDPTPAPAVGTTPPVPQPGRAAMSQQATDDSVRMLSFGGTFLLICCGGGIVMVTSDYADPTVIGVSGGVLAAVLLAAARLMRRTKEVVEAAPAQITQNIHGDVHHQHTEINSTAKGVIAYSRNNLPNYSRNNLPN